jgi:hypothetical protein
MQKLCYCVCGSFVRRVPRVGSWAKSQNLVEKHLFDFLPFRQSCNFGSVRKLLQVAQYHCQQHQLLTTKNAGDLVRSILYTTNLVLYSQIALTLSIV